MLAFWPPAPTSHGTSAGFLGGDDKTWISLGKSSWVYRTMVPARSSRSASLPLRESGCLKQQELDDGSPFGSPFKAYCFETPPILQSLEIRGIADEARLAPNGPVAL